MTEKRIWLPKSLRENAKVKKAFGKETRGRKPAPRETRLCLHCGHPFVTSQIRDKQYCSMACYRASQPHKPQVTTTCKQCGKSFEHPLYLTPIFCSRLCRIEWNRLHAKPHTPKREKIPIPCAFCHAQFKVVSIGSRGNSRFCSFDCDMNFEAIEKRIKQLWFFEYEKQALELERLKREGNGYRFPSPYENLNDFYFHTEPTEPQSPKEWQKATEDFYSELGYKEGEKNE